MLVCGLRFPPFGCFFRVPASFVFVVLFRRLLVLCFPCLLSCLLACPLVCRAWWRSVRSLLAFSLLARASRASLSSGGCASLWGLRAWGLGPNCWAAVRCVGAVLAVVLAWRAVAAGAVRLAWCWCCGVLGVLVGGCAVVALRCLGLCAVRGLVALCGLVVGPLRSFFSPLRFVVLVCTACARAGSSFLAVVSVAVAPFSRVPPTAGFQRVRRRTWWGRCL